MTLTVWLALTLPLQPGPIEPTLDVGGSVSVRVALPPRIGGLAVGPLVLISEAAIDPTLVLEHERGHVRQFEALGPAFWAAYALSLGRAFEDYLTDSPWHPDASWPVRCPLVRVTPQAVDALPCWGWP